MRPLTVMTLTGFSGYAALLPVAPLWAVHGGAGAGGAGLVNGVLLLFTVLTQFLVPSALRRFGWATTLSVGLAMLGVPALLYGLSDALGPILVVSALRGVGFGVLTVTGSAAVAALVAPERRGEAIGVYGLAVALPNLFLLAAAPWVAENLGFWVVFVVSALPVAGIPAARRLAAALPDDPPELPTGTVEGPRAAVYLPLLRPTLLLLSVTLAGGAAITFVPQMVSGDALAATGLFVMGLVAALGRWRAGLLADRFGSQRFLWPLVLVTGVSTALVGWSVRDPDATGATTFLVAAGLLGLAYGALQNLTLIVAFGSVSRRHHNAASAVWNVGFDAGTAMGSVAVGIIAEQTSFSTAFLVVAAVAVAVLPVAAYRPRPVAHPPDHRKATP
ncbi:MFS transporter [Nocardioides sp. MJB4]|uniref:MFS transporter n=2 Tax=Nocardioides donggukensis TaxID=2774019 RepID=A0A927Q324_9ACTN|nr:MFS transporter [Nocardioides donggukensis]